MFYSMTSDDPILNISVTSRRSPESIGLHHVTREAYSTSNE